MSRRHYPKELYPGQPDPNYASPIMSYPPTTTFGQYTSTVPTNIIPPSIGNTGATQIGFSTPTIFDPNAQRSVGPPPLNTPSRVTPPPFTSALGPAPSPGRIATAGPPLGQQKSISPSIITPPPSTTVSPFPQPLPNTATTGSSVAPPPVTSFASPSSITPLSTVTPPPFTTPSVGPPPLTTPSVGPPPLTTPTRTAPAGLSAPSSSTLNGYPTSRGPSGVILPGTTGVAPPPTAGSPQAQVQQFIEPDMEGAIPSGGYQNQTDAYVGQITDHMGQIGISPSGPPSTSGHPDWAMGGGMNVGMGQMHEPTPPKAEAQCPPEFLRMTINAIPDSPTLATRAGIPLGCIVHPMAEPEGKIPVVNFGSVGVLRCRKCRAYINPFIQYIDGGRRWRCNFCGMPNDMPLEYYRELDHTGNRVDQNERPELSRGCVEFIAPAEYTTRRPMPPTYFFVIDVSYYSVSSGMLKACVESIKSSLDSLPDNTRSNIGFITFDSNIHFYNLNSNLTQPRMLVVSEIDDVFLPLPDDMLVNLKESRTVVDALLARLPSIHQNTNDVEVAVGPALKAAWHVMKAVGGKMMLFLSKLPSRGAAALKMRDDPKLLGSDKEMNLLRPQTNLYKEFALDCSKQQISVDTFLFSAQYTDVATLGCLARYTGGQTNSYPAFNAARDGLKFSKDLQHILTRQTGWEAVLRVRATKGVKVQQHFGNFYIKSGDLLSLPNIDSDKAFGVQFQITDPLAGTKYVSIQNALLYTTSSGERRIRVATVCLPVTSILADLFKYADCDAVTVLTCKLAIEKALASKLADARQALLVKCVDILSIYRTSFASPTASSTQLFLPDSLKLLPLYTLSLIKHTAFRSGADVRPDERCNALDLLRTLPISGVIPMIYPRLYGFRGISDDCGTPGPNNSIILPPVNNLLSQRLDHSGIYLLDNSQYLLLWVGKAAPPDLLQQLFGVSSLYTIDESLLRLVPQNNETSKRICAIIDGVRRQNLLWENLYVVREGDQLEYPKFFAHFVEDQSRNGLPSYYEFLVTLQRKVQERAGAK